MVYSKRLGLFKKHLFYEGQVWPRCYTVNDLVYLKAFVLLVTGMATMVYSKRLGLFKSTCFIGDRYGNDGVQ